MTNERLIRVLFKASLISFFIPLIFSALLFSRLFGIALRRALKEKGTDRIVRLVGSKGLLVIFDIFRKKKEKS